MNGYSLDKPTAEFVAFFSTGTPLNHMTTAGACKAVDNLSGSPHSMVR
jgi:hypothetical protein